MYPYPSTLMSSLASLAAQHPKPADLHFQYGTAGFRTLYGIFASSCSHSDHYDSGNTLDSVLFRVGVLAGLRSKRLDGKTIGVMITASHNPAQVRTYRLRLYGSV